jgi:putative inorganic carbon (HCO3(-)) transporter
MRLGEALEKIKNPLAAVIAVEALGAGFVMAGLLPREASLFLLGVFVFFVTFAPMKHAVLFAVFSIPLYTALPITESFDSMAAWRIIIAILFLRTLVGYIPSLITLPPHPLSYFKRGGGFIDVFSRSPSLSAPGGNVREGAGGESYGVGVQKCRLIFLLGLFFLLGAVSLLVAPEPIFGIKKLLYLANIFALFFVIREVVKNKQDFVDILKYVFAGSALALAIGYAQFITILFVPLYTFWQWWASHVIPVFYGANLGNLLSYSNTWFSYYEEAEATLRVFSVFPDSHSFALSMVLALPMALTFFIMSKGRARIALGSFVVLALLAIIFSGTRGVWVGAVPVFILLGTIYLATRYHPSPLLRKEGNNSPPYEGGVPRPQSGGGGVVIRTGIIAFVAFALLFPVSSQLLKFSQMRQGGIVSETAFERISTAFSTRELSNLGRIQIWKSTLESIARRPFLGVGIGNYPVVLNENVSATKEGASAHSLYLDFASEIGVLGAVLLLLIFFSILWRGIMEFLRNKDPLLSAFSGFFAVYFLWVMVYSAVDVVLMNDKVLLLFTTLVALLYARINHNSR